MQRRRRASVLVAALAAGAVLVAAGCATVPGSVAGEPCNDNGVCATGLICDVNNICQDENGPGPTSAWQLMRLPDNPTIYGVWGHSASDVIAVGASGKVFTYDGNGTDDFVFAAKGLTTNTLYSVWGSGKQYWAVGNSAALYYDGSQWSDVSKLWDKAAGKELQASYTLHGVHGDGSTGVIFAVGQLSSSTALVVRWNSSARRWETVDEANLAFTGMAVWVQGSQAWIVGSAQHVKHFGGKWEEQNLPENANLNAVWSNGSRLAAVGPGGKIFQYSSSGWVEQNDVRESYTANGLWGDSDTLYIVGDGGGYQEQYTSIETCTSVCRPNIIDEKARSRSLKGIWGTGSTLFAVGASGTILRRAQ